MMWFKTLRRETVIFWGKSKEAHAILSHVINLSDFSPKAHKFRTQPKPTGA